MKSAGRQDVEMSLGTDRSIRLTIADNALKDPAVTAKSGVYENSGNDCLDSFVKQANRAV